MSSPSLNGRASRVDETLRVLSSQDREVLERIAAELENKALTPQRRFELLQAIDDVAARYACDDPNVD